MKGGRRATVRCVPGSRRRASGVRPGPRPCIRNLPIPSAKSGARRRGPGPVRGRRPCIRSLHPHRPGRSPLAATSAPTHVPAPLHQPVCGRSPQQTADHAVPPLCPFWFLPFPADGFRTSPQPLGMMEVPKRTRRRWCSPGAFRGGTSACAASAVSPAQRRRTSPS